MQGRWEVGEREGGPIHLFALHSRKEFLQKFLGMALHNKPGGSFLEGRMRRDEMRRVEERRD